MECLRAAVLNGADAVYFGGGLFNARRGAKNFDEAELKEAVDYCRLRGVKTNVTLNTLLFDRELEEALRFASRLLSLHADAVIVQDLGLAALIRRELPELAVHASTQMGVHSLGGLRFCEKLGIERAVLAREVPLEEIRRMHENSDVELEFFCHGALCMGFSGSCLYSSMAGERSGNRGTCAQPCRKNASVLRKRAGADEFALSTNDICMIDELDSLISAGICSLKIEGRMKSPEYVAAVTRVYRAALDGEKPNDARKTLFSIFNRGEFSTAHLRGDSVTTGHVGSAKPSKELIARTHELMRRDVERRGLAINAKLIPGEPAELTLAEKDLTVKVTGEVCEEAEKPADMERLLGRLGGTPFFAKDISVKGGGYLPAAKLNALRREGISRMTDAILGEPGREKSITQESISGFIRPAGRASGAPGRYLRVRSLEGIAPEDAELVGIDPVFPDKAIPEFSGRLVLILPNALLTERERRTYEKLLESGVFSGVEVNNISQWDMGRELPVRIAGIGMNAFNSAAFTLLSDLGFTHIMPSLELTRRDLAHLADSFGSVMIVNTLGRAPLMQLVHCPVKEYRGCRGCRGDAGVLADGEGRRFPLRNVRFPDGRCLVRLMNSAVTDIREAFAASGIGAAMTAETPDDETEAQITRGHWNRAVE